jgi:hypothetical protein
VDEISCLSTKEWVMLRATLHALDNKRFLCTPCNTGEKYAFREDKERMIKAEKSAKACTEIRSDVIHQITDINGRINFKTCIGNYFSHGALHIIGLYNYFEKGFLPYPGTIQEQPNKIIEAFNVIEAYRIMRAKSEAAKEEAKTQQRITRG